MLVTNKGLLWGLVSGLDPLRYTPSSTNSSGSRPRFRLWGLSDEHPGLMDSDYRFTEWWNTCTFSQGSEMASKGRELANHFLSEGTPVMIGEFFTLTFKHVSNDTPSAHFIRYTCSHLFEPFWALVTKTGFNFGWHCSALILQCLLMWLYFAVMLILTAVSNILIEFDEGIFKIIIVQSFVDKIQI